MGQLVLNDVRKSYDGKQVVHGIDLDVAGGQFVVVVGPSGCGKSTLLRMIAGLEDITSGEIAIDGEIVNDVEPGDRRCSMVFQNYALYPHMTVRKNMDYPLKIARLSKEERATRVAEAARILDLEPYLDRRPAQLSGGQRQRVAMGRAIVRNPALFLFDEPLSNLDAKLRVQMRIEIKKLHRRLNATTVFVTHDQVEAMTMADLLVVMNGGHVEQAGTPVDVYRRPASTFVAGFLGAPAMNLLNASIKGSQPVLETLPEATLASPTLLAEDRRVVVGIRPEDIAFAGSGEPGMPARIDLIEELGGSRIAHCTFGTEEIAVVLPRELIATEGDLLQLRFKESALHLFDLETGRRIDMAMAEGRA